MAAQLLDGKTMSNELREKLALRVDNLKARGVTPGLAVILVGEDPASQIYVKNKGLGCAQVGMHSVTIRMPETTTQQELETQIDQLNGDASIHGILVQLPLPAGLDEAAALARIAPERMWMDSMWSMQASCSPARRALWRARPRAPWR